MSETTRPFTRRRAVAIVALWIAAAVAMGLLVERPDQESTEGTKLYLPETLESQAAQKRLKELFPEQYRYSTAIVVFHRREGISLSQLSDPNGPIGQLVKWVRDPQQLPESVPRERADEMRSYLRDAPVRSTVTDPYLIESLTARDDEGTLITTLVAIGMPDIFTATRAKATVKTIRDHLEAMQKAGGLDRLQFEVTGDAGFYLNYSEASTESIDRSTVVTVILVVLILLIVYRSPVAMLVPLLTLAVGIHVAMRVLFLLAPLGFHADEVVEMFVVVMLFGSGTDYCLFIIARYKEEADHGVELPVAMGHSLRSTAAAIAASALTTVAGLSLMSLAIFRPFQKAGSSIAVALAVGCLASLTLAPSLYLLAGRTIFWPRRKNAPPKPLTGDLWDRIAKTVTRWPLVATLLVLLVLAAPSINSLYTTTTHNIFDELSSGWTSVRGFEILKRDFGPGKMGPLTILVEADGKDNALDDDHGWSLMLRLADRLSEHPMVDNVYCPGQPRGRGTTRYENVDELDPDSQIMRAITNYFFNGDFTAARLEVFLREGPYTDASVAAARELQLISRNVTSGAPGIKSVLMAGPSSTIADIKDVARHDFRVTSAAVLIAVYVILLIVLRRPVLGLFLIGGTLLSFMTAYGAADWVFVHLLGHPGLDWKIKFFLLVLLVAVGVDYNIYVCTRIKQERLRRPLTEAVRVALGRTGGIVSACGIIVAGTFASMMFGLRWPWADGQLVWPFELGYLSLMVQLGFALALGILVDTFLVRPLLVPAVALMLSRISERRKAKSQQPDNPDAAP